MRWRASRCRCTATAGTGATGAAWGTTAPPAPRRGGGENVRGWLYVEDNCAAVDLALRKGKDGEIYNIGGGNEVENIVITRQILRLAGKPESLITPGAGRPGGGRPSG